MPSASAIARAQRREPFVKAFIELVDAGATQLDAHAALCRRGLDLSVMRLKHWSDVYRRNGFPGLAGNAHNSGRPSAVDRLVEAIGEEKATEIFRQVRATAHDTKSAVLATRFVGRSDSAPEEFANFIDYREDGGRRRSKHHLPRSFRDEIRINPALALKHEGNRANSLRGIYSPRKLDILPGDVFTSDDTTPIWGWWVPWPHALGNPDFPKASCEYRFGVKLLQGQLLPVMDVASNYVITLALIARETSAYRASDIAALFGRVFEHVGLPRLGFQFERGTWESNLLMGVEVEIGEGEMPVSQRVGGLRMLPTNITAGHRQMHGEDFTFASTLQIFTSYLPKTKPVEAWFDRSQSLEGMIFGNLGRDQMRRPNEAAKKKFEAGKRGSIDPRLHFLSGVELMKRLKALVDFGNTEPMEGEVFRGVPKLLWEQALREHPLLVLPEDSQYLFRRNWAVAKVTRGMVALKRRDEQDRTTTTHYCHPERFAAHEGKQVLAYWDHEDIESPAQIHDAESKAFLCLADYQPRVGMFLDGASHGFENRRRYNNAVTTLYAPIAERAPSRQVPQEILERRAAALGTQASLPARSEAVATTTNLPKISGSETARAARALDPRNTAAADPRLAELLTED